MRIPLRAVCVRGSAPCANGRPRTEVTMQISMRSLSVLVLVLLAAACGSTSDSNNMPAANGGAVVQGTVMGGSQNMRVAVPSSSAATTTDSAGGFVLTGVPKGAAALQFSGAGQNATLADRKSTRLNSSHGYISYAVFCLKKKKKQNHTQS